MTNQDWLDFINHVKEWRAEAVKSASQNAEQAMNSYGAGYSLGYADALGELLEQMTDGK